MITANLPWYSQSVIDWARAILLQGGYLEAEQAEGTVSGSSRRTHGTFHASPNVNRSQFSSHGRVCHLEEARDRVGADCGHKYRRRRRRQRTPSRPPSLLTRCPSAFAQSVLRWHRRGGADAPLYFFLYSTNCSYGFVRYMVIIYLRNFSLS